MFVCILSARRLFVSLCQPTKFIVNMIAALDIQVTKTPKSRLSEIDFDHLPFGKYFTDHMLEVDYADGEWKKVVIRSFQDLSLSPALAAIHYGQAIFEGIKGY